MRTGNLLFLTGMLPTEGREVKFIGRIGAELDLQTGCKAAYLATLNGLAVARQHLGSLDRINRIVRVGVLVATSGDVREHQKVADGASELDGHKASIEVVFLRCSGTFVFHRDPQVHCGRFRGKGSNLSDHILDRLRGQVVRTKRFEPAKVGDRRRQFMR